MITDKAGATPARLAVLADPTRQALLNLLREKPHRVGELAKALRVSGPAVSQHLRVLRHTDLVQEKRMGTSHFFSLNPVGFAALREYAESMWQEALGAFAAHVTAQSARSRKRTPLPKKGHR